MINLRIYKWDILHCPPQQQARCDKAKEAGTEDRKDAFGTVAPKSPSKTIPNPTNSSDYSEDSDHFACRLKAAATAALGHSAHLFSFESEIVVGYKEFTFKEKPE